ncbi:flagellar assembly peptidoglycan hydrolase FlgJ [Duganella sp. FT92W]|uniref:Flagellar assembly peptidoglycan hydrolase FlgJ n=1 Tax=Pseudoduganella rivuli TaxID=2666085 RepID=A0A7X2IRQ4_9BURK|nr:glucosaminidase domain-containing protein [Pseudoduganella rivuli]MRV74816.1 flagellar assembly peptidoglycan hydrolase FlgJ [Pseudoduganella rivuli]
MSRPDFTAFTATTRPTQATAATLSNVRPTAATGGASASFAASFSTSMAAMNAPFASGGNTTFSKAQRDVAAFIQEAVSPEPGVLPSQSSASLAMRARAAGMADSSGAIMAATLNNANSASQKEFLESIMPWATEAAQKLGVAPELVAAHAALESGWGQHPLGASNNLFGIKAGSQWQGGVTSAATTEYAYGLPMKKVEKFRSYPDTASAFRDYANVLVDNPRYRDALNTGSDARAFAQGVARGGYATDPSYADKLMKLATQLQRRQPVQPTGD